MNDDLQDVENIPVMGISPMRGSGFEQTSTVFSAIARSKDTVDANASLCVSRQMAVRELDVSDVNPGLQVSKLNCVGELDSENLTACNRVMRQKSDEGMDGNAGDAASGPVAEYITPAPKEFVEAGHYEIDEWQCCVDFKELCYVRMRIWRRLWHSRATPSDASKSERSWRRLSKRLCHEEGF